MRIKAVIFDLDGTLLDSIHDIAFCMNEALKRLGLPTHDLPAYKIMVGDGVEMLVERGIPEPARSARMQARVLSELRREYAGHWGVDSRVFPGIPELLDGLTRRGIDMAILTNKPHEVTNLVVRKYFGAWPISPVWGADPARARKPAPNSALRIAEQLGASPSEVILIGDTRTDMETAVASGMFPLGAGWGYRGEDELLAYGARAVFYQPTTLLALLPEVVQS